MLRKRRNSEKAMKVKIVNCDFQLAFVGFNSMPNLFVIQSIISLYLYGFNCKG